MAHNYDTLVKFGVTDSARGRFGIDTPVGGEVMQGKATVLIQRWPTEW